MDNNLKINSDLLDLYVKKSDYTELESERQRLKEENEILQEKLQIALKNNASKTAIRLENKDLQAENERLKEEIKQYKNI